MGRLGTLASAAGIVLTGLVCSASAGADLVRAAASETGAPQVFMSCGWPPTTGPYGSSEGSISYRQHPSRCYYSGDGSDNDLINLVGIQWSNWGALEATAKAKRVDNSDQDRDGFQRHPVRIVLSDLRPAVGHAGTRKLYYTRMKVTFAEGGSYVWSLYRPGQGAVQLPTPKPPQSAKIHRVCGPLLPDGIGAYSYIETWGVRCAPAMRVAFRARKRFCSRHDDCQIYPALPISTRFKGHVRYRRWACKVTVAYESTRVHCHKQVMRLIYRSAA